MGVTPSHMAPLHVTVSVSPPPTPRDLRVSWGSPSVSPYAFYSPPTLTDSHPTEFKVGTLNFSSRKPHENNMGFTVLGSGSPWRIQCGAKVRSTDRQPELVSDADAGPCPPPTESGRIPAGAGA